MATVQGLKNALTAISRKVEKAAVMALKITLRDSVLKDIKRRLSGSSTGSDTLKKKSGALYRSFKFVPPEVNGSLISGKIQFDPQTNPMGVSTKRYWKTHFGPAGSKQFIAPVRCQWLTIPLPAAMGARGYPKAPARSATWGPTTIFNHLIWGSPGYKGPGGKGGGGGGWKPLWILRQRVSVPRRIDMVPIAEEAKIRFAAEFGKRLGKI
jgi:hypothetical protein